MGESDFIVYDVGVILNVGEINFGVLFEFCVDVLGINICLC